MGHLASSQGHNLNCGYDPGPLWPGVEPNLSLLRPRIDEKLSWIEAIPLTLLTQ